MIKGGKNAQNWPRKEIIVEGDKNESKLMQKIVEQGSKNDSKSAQN